MRAGSCLPLSQRDFALGHFSGVWATTSGLAVQVGASRAELLLVSDEVKALSPEYSQEEEATPRGPSAPPMLCLSLIQY